LIISILGRLSRRDWAVGAIGLAVAIGFVVAAFFDLIAFPRLSFPILYALPVLLAALRFSPRVVAGIAMIALAADIVGVWKSGEHSPMLVLVTATLAAVCLLTVAASRQRARISALREVSETHAERTERLQRVTAALSEATDPQSVARVVVDEGVAALGAQAGSLRILSPDGSELRLLHWRGYALGILSDQQQFSIDSQTPLAEAARTGKPVFVSSIAEGAKRYPDAIRPQHAAWQGALAAIPLTIDGRVLGTFGISFAEAREFSPVDREFALTLAHQAAQALHRSRLYQGESEARALAERSQERLAFLSDASRTLHSSLDYYETFKTLARLMVPRIADWSQVFIVEDDGRIRLIAYAVANPDKIELAEAMERLYPVTMDDPGGTATAFQSRRSYMREDITDETLTRTAKDAEHLRLLRAFGLRSLIVVPLIARGRLLGAIAAHSADSARHYTAEDRVLVEELAERAALAIDNARLYSAEQTARKQAERAVKLRDEFIAIAAHELKTPLTNLRGYAQLEMLRLRRLNVVDPVAIRRALTVIDRQSARLANLVSRLFDVTALDEGRIELYLEVVDVNALVEDVAARFETTLERHTLVLTRAPNAHAAIDRARIEQVLANLLDNAVRYSPDGGEIVVSIAKPSDATIQIAVRDDGPGIPHERRGQLLERYFQADPENHRSGLGLGLFISHRLVVLHGGTLAVEFPFDGGTRVVVTLPASPDGQSEIDYQIDVAKAITPSGSEGSRATAARDSSLPLGMTNA
jgi:signal transduction histidine kinase